MEHLGFIASLANPDVWMRPEIKSNVQERYECVLLHTDDDLVVSDEVEDIVRNQIGKHFVVKKQSVGHPNRHLGGSVRKVQLKNMADAWAFSSSQYVRAATDNVENYLNNKGTSFPKSCDSPLLTP